MQIFSKLGNDFKFIYDKAFENEFSLEKNYFEIIVWIIIVKKLKLFGLLIHKCVLLDMGGGSRIHPLKIGGGVKFWKQRTCRTKSTMHGQNENRQKSLEKKFSGKKSFY